MDQGLWNWARVLTTFQPPRKQIEAPLDLLMTADEDEIVPSDQSHSTGRIRNSLLSPYHREDRRSGPPTEFEILKRPTDRGTPLLEAEHVGRAHLECA